MSSATLRLQVPDIRCAACALRIEDAVRDMGINRCRTNVASKQVIVEHDPDTCSAGDIEQKIRAIGFDAVTASLDEENQIDESKVLLTRLGVAGIGSESSLSHHVSGW